MLKGAQEREAFSVPVENCLCTTCVWLLEMCELTVDCSDSDVGWELLIRSCSGMHQNDFHFQGRIQCNNDGILVLKCM